MDSIIRLFPPAKINLNLTIVGKRTDGLHQIDSLVVPIDWRDSLVIQPAAALTLSVQWNNTITYPQNENNNSQAKITAQQPPAPNDNIVMRAAVLLQKYLQQHAPNTPIQGAHLILVKNIPVGAGLGGGSSDAAATLIGLNKLWQINLHREVLCQIGFTLGADIPLFLLGEPARVQGAGETIQPLTLPEIRKSVNYIQPTITGSAHHIMHHNDTSEIWAVIVTPLFHCDTAVIYRTFATMKKQKQCKKKHNYPVTDSSLELTNTASRIPLPPSLANANDLAQAVAYHHPQFAEIMHRLTKHCGEYWYLSGSGVSIFSVCNNQAQAVRLCNQVQQLQQRFGMMFRAIKATRVLAKANVFGV